jgi:hypothetical protein
MDRFARSGLPIESNEKAMALFEDNVLYKTGISFHEKDSSTRGYRVPLIPGSYRITLFFAEIEYDEEGMRRFDVLLEGKTALKDCEPKINEAEAHSFERLINDGFLDIEFVPRTGNPMISAIEIELLQ